MDGCAQAADLFGFLRGKAGFEPFHAVNRVAYSNRAHNFLYTPRLYGPPHQYATGADSAAAGAGVASAGLSL